MKNILANTDPQDLYALDECSILLSTTVKKVVTRRGNKPVLKIERLYKGVNIVGAIRGTKEIVFQILEGKCDKFAFMKYLGYLKHVNEYRTPHIVLDNANFHRNKEVYAYIAENAIELHFQPTHSPFLNAAEEIWRQLRQWLRGRLFYNLERLKYAIYEFFTLSPRLNISVASYFS